MTNQAGVNAGWRTTPRITSRTVSSVAYPVAHRFGSTRCRCVYNTNSTIWKMGNQAHTVDGKLVDISKQIERTLNKLPQS